MKTVWTAGMDADASQEITSDFKSANLLRKRLDAILCSKISSCREDALSKNKYDSPSWAYLQADAVGYERALKEVISIISE
jgi:hypothetical protein